MKKVLASGVVVLMVLFLSAGFGLAKGPGGGGGGQGGDGAGDGTGPIHNILEGTVFDYTGTVLTIVVGGGVEIATEAVDDNGEPIFDDNGDAIIVIVTIYGIGPVRYWDELGVDRLLVEDTITVSGYNVIYSTDTEGTEVSRNIAVTIITAGGVEVSLRDLETGAPLWRQKGGNIN